jgi:hypothetical protein
METTGRNVTHDDTTQPLGPGLPRLLLIWPCVPTLASDAGVGRDRYRRLWNALEYCGT